MELPPAFIKYIKIKDKMDELTKQKDECTQEMIDYMDEMHQNVITTPIGVFTRTGRRSYEYSDNVKQMQARVLQIKKDEERTGIAQLKSDGEWVRFDKIKRY